MQISAATVESRMEFFQKIKNGTALWPSDSTSGYISEETENTHSQESMHPYLHCSVIYNSQDLEAVKMSISRLVGKMLWYIYLWNTTWLWKRKEILPFVTAWMDLEIIMLSEISQAEEDKYQVISLICGI